VDFPGQCLHRPPTPGARSCASRIARTTRSSSPGPTAGEQHLERRNGGRPESIESSALHLDILRDLKRINSHLSSVAYPILDSKGELRPSRLKAASVSARRSRRSRARATPSIRRAPAPGSGEIRPVASSPYFRGSPRANIRGGAWPPAVLVG